MSGLILSVLIGGSLGAALGRFNQCKSGTCQLMANWKRGAIYGAVLGLMFHFASGGSSGPYQEPQNVKPIAEANFDAEVTQAGKPVVVDFFAPWCGPCKVLSPRLDELAGEFGDRIKFVSVNVDEAPSLASKFNVQGIPTLLFIGADGKVAETTVGLVSQKTLREKLAALSGTEVNRTASSQPKEI